MKSGLLTMVSAIAMISQMLINFGNRIIISQGNFEFVVIPVCIGDSDIISVPRIQIVADKENVVTIQGWNLRFS